MPGQGSTSGKMGSSSFTNKPIAGLISTLTSYFDFQMEDAIEDMQHFVMDSSISRTVSVIDQRTIAHLEPAFAANCNFIIYYPNCYLLSI